MEQDLISVVKSSEAGVYNVIYNFGGKIIGEIYCEVDGYYVFNMDGFGGGSWDAKGLRAISDKLDEMNKPFDDQLTEYFKKNNKEKNKNGYGSKQQTATEKGKD
jgi:hypothetical protein